MSDLDFQEEAYGAFGAFDSATGPAAPFPGMPPAPGAPPALPPSPGSGGTVMMTGAPPGQPLAPGQHGPPTAVAVRHSMPGPVVPPYTSLEPHQPIQQAMAATPDLANNDGAHSLGLSILLVGVGIAVGTYYKGIWGGVSGGLYGGALANFVRAGRNMTHGTPDSDREAIISGTYGVLSSGVASYLLWKYGGKHGESHA